MSEQQEDFTDDLGAMSLDDEDQLQPEETLDHLEGDGDAEDPLDRGYSPPDTDRSSQTWGTTAYEQQQDETIEQRITQEIPEDGTAYGAPENESGLDTVLIGGDDQDAIAPEDDWYGEPESDEAAERDTRPRRGDASAEESALHIVEE
ncbi:MAG: hypothetical protein Q4G67_07985 [Actinomycetia bacterium]|nr:hypothetical protein [Actinomycetes bacterium]